MSDQSKIRRWMNPFFVKHCYRMLQLNRKLRAEELDINPFVCWLIKSNVILAKNNRKERCRPHILTLKYQVSVCITTNNAMHDILN